MKAIIPCTTFSSSPHNKSKEMLYDPFIKKNVIDYPLDLCRQFNIEPIIVTIGKKQDLIDYCATKQVKTVILDRPTDWTGAMLDSRPYWGDTNLLLLPDIRFSPLSVIFDIQTSMSLGADSALGLHLVSNASQWCVVNKDYTIVEKPFFKTPAWALGIMAYTPEYGEYVFKELSERGSSALLTNASLYYFTHFKNITSTGKVEY